MNRLLWTLLLSLFSGACAAEQTGGCHYSYQMGLRGDRTHFKSGEPIVVVLSVHVLEGSLYVPVSWSSGSVEVTEGPGGQLFKLDRGTWLRAESMGLLPALAKAGEVRALSIALNRNLRFDGVGAYSVRLHVRFSEGTDPKHFCPLTTEPLSFTVEMADEVGEAQRAQALYEALRQAPSAWDAMEIANELAWLPGQAAADLKLACVLDPANVKGCGPWFMGDALWFTRDRARVVEILEQALLDPSSDFVADPFRMMLAVSLRSSLVDPKGRDQRRTSQAVEQGYARRLAVTLDQRHGRNLIAAARAILNAYVFEKKENLDTPDLVAARQALALYFNEIDPGDRSYIRERLGIGY